MSYFAVPLNEDANISRSEDELAPVTSRLLGGVAVVENTLKQLPVGALGIHGSAAYTAHFDPGPFLTTDQIKEQYPVVTSDFPKGGHEHNVRFLSDTKSQQLMSQELIDNMPPGFLTEVTKIVGFGIANVMDPIARIGGSLVEKVFQKVGFNLAANAAGVISKHTSFGETSSKLMARAVIGVSEGGALITPYAMSSRDYFNQLHMPQPISTTLEIFGIGGGLGAFARVLAGYKSPIEIQEEKNARAVINDQMAAGKKPDISLILKNGVRQARLKEGEVNLPDLQKGQAELELALRDNVSKLEQASKEFESVKEEHPEARDIETPNREGRHLVDRALEIAKIPEEARVSEDTELINNLPDNEEIQSAITLKNVPREDLDINQQKFLDRFDNGEEEDLIKERKQNFRERLEENIKKTKALPKDDERVQDLLIEKNKLNRSLEIAKERLNELREMKEPAKLSKLRKNIIQLKTDQLRLKEHLNDLSAYIRLVSKEHPAVTAQELQEASERINSWKGNQTTNLNEFYKAERKLEAPVFSDDELIADAEDVINNLKEGDLLEDEVKDVINELPTIEKKETGIDKALRALKGCMSSKQEGD